ncbi:MAG: hypothetical protein V2I33_16190, partial [Kangiellaceae bacterium]|nr:hypothetical protein [Kangiellaceae bacterium]
SSNIVLKIADYHKPAQFPGKASIGTAAVDNWKYAVVSVEMIDGIKSNVVFFIDNVAEAT